MAQQILPTKKEFLATGLEPVEHEMCPICYEAPMKSPVRVNCDGKHTFCKECIVTWLDQPDVNTCPKCRQQLFSANEPTEEVALEDLEREADSLREHIEDVFRAHVRFHRSAAWAFRDLRPFGSTDPAVWAAFEESDREADLLREQVDESLRAYFRLRRSADWAYVDRRHGIYAQTNR
jgi:hypothetical protein